MAQPVAKNSKPQYLYLALLGGFILAIWLGSTLFGLPSVQAPGIASDCDLNQQSCTVDMGEVSLTVDIQPRPVRSMTPLNYRVSIDGTSASKVIINLQGSEMYMGINQTQLTPVESSPGNFSGQGELAVCTTGEMLWRLTVSAETAAGPINTWFEFRAK
ncbi:hypothetical protein [Amphritea pacifica]|uniref:YtkA-like domain-containing protein n=1 Tax=Amphritea pacifica TaxID=2811233 RepID=A0ABS2WD66_9GAMM|nr:hypothetical protein [Amphritea pacifica]MBN0989533.1 hypothetical protein [Amphritea pacifica]MBN1008360.1 hypothetical protein [Amphritea pacifica]